MKKRTSCCLTPAFNCPKLLLLGLIATLGWSALELKADPPQESTEHSATTTPPPVTANSLRGPVTCGNLTLDAKNGQGALPRFRLDASSPALLTQKALAQEPASHDQIAHRTWSATLEPTAPTTTASGAGSYTFQKGLEQTFVKQTTNALGSKIFTFTAGGAGEQAHTLVGYFWGSGNTGQLALWSKENDPLPENSTLYGWEVTDLQPHEQSRSHPPEDLKHQPFSKMFTLTQLTKSTALTSASSLAAERSLAFDDGDDSPNPGELAPGNPPLTPGLVAVMKCHQTGCEAQWQENSGEASAGSSSSTGHPPSLALPLMIFAAETLKPHFTATVAAQRKGQQKKLQKLSLQTIVGTPLTLAAAATALYYTQRSLTARGVRGVGLELLHQTLRVGKKVAPLTSRWFPCRPSTQQRLKARAQEELERALTWKWLAKHAVQQSLSRNPSRISQEAWVLLTRARLASTRHELFNLLAGATPQEIALQALRAARVVALSPRISPRGLPTLQE